MMSIVIKIKALDNNCKHMYTKAGKISEYVESIYQGCSIIMKYALSEYKDKLSSLNLVRENHVPYMVGWVKHFIVLGDPDDAAFADILYREGRKDWQIRKALDAVKIYRGIYPEDSAAIKAQLGEPLQIINRTMDFPQFRKFRAPDIA